VQVGQVTTSTVTANAEIVEPLGVRRYNYSNAVNYANQWVTSGGQKRNSSYPNFTDNDCTNFTSQVALAGGISMQGNGTCRYEANFAEWYVMRSSSPWYWPCVGSNSSWAWSTSWSAVGDFRYYMRDKAQAYVEAYPANNESVALLISRARTGDFIQYDVRSCTSSSCPWVPTHGTVVVERKNNGGYYTNDILLNDHSGGSNGNDNVKTKLRDKYQTWVNGQLTNLRRIVWIKMP